MDKDKFNARFGFLLKMIRKRMKVTQTDFSKKIGVEQSAYSRIESGEQQLTLFQLTLASQTLDFDMKKLLNLATNEKFKLSYTLEKTERDSFADQIINQCKEN